MIKWYSSDKLEVFFSDIPAIGIRYILPSDTKEEQKSKKKFPFINKKNLDVRLVDYKKKEIYDFTIPKGYCYDGASIPRIFWRVIGSNTDNNFLIAALVHDVLCQNHSYINNDRKFSSVVFSSLLEVSDVNPFKRFLMKNAVDFHQLFCHWGVKTENI